MKRLMLAASIWIFGNAMIYGATHKWSDFAEDLVDLGPTGPMVTSWSRSQGPAD